MSIYGVSNSSATRLTPQLPLRDNPRTQTQTTALPVGVPATQTGGQKAAAAKLAQQSVPAEAPAGTDPALWSVLSGEERAFFAKSGATGPLTYGRALRDMGTAQMPASSRGGRLDVKV